jgi:hypothetical protein
MTDKPDREGASTPFEGGDKPVPNPIEGSKDKQPSTPGLDPAAFAAQVAPLLTPVMREIAREEAARENQSNKDRRLKVVDGIPAGFLQDLYKRAQANGGNIEAAIRDVELDAVREKVLRGDEGKDAEDPVRGRTGGQPTREEIAKAVSERTETILDNAGIEPGDEKFKEFVDQHRKAKTEPAAYLAALETWAWRESRQRATAEGAAIQVQGGKPPDPKQVGLRKEYDAEMAKVRPGDIDGVFKVRRDFRAKGLEGV